MATKVSGAAAWSCSIRWRRMGHRENGGGPAPNFALTRREVQRERHVAGL
jgi:hypothetical protein